MTCSFITGPLAVLPRLHSRLPGYVTSPTAPRQVLRCLKEQRAALEEHIKDIDREITYAEAVALGGASGPCRSLTGRAGSFHCAAEALAHCRQAGTVRQGHVGPSCFGSDRGNPSRPRVHPDPLLTTEEWIR